MSEASFEALLAQVDYGLLTAKERWELGLKAEKLAESNEDELALYQIRMRLIPMAHEVTEEEGMLSRFLWCAYKNDANPAKFPIKPVPTAPAIDLLWWYKWLIGMLYGFSHFSIGQIEAALDMMQKAYKREGAGQSGILWAQYNWRRYLQDDEAAEALMKKIKATALDDYSNCEACSLAAEVTWYLNREDEAKALELVDQIIEDKLSCGEEPETVISLSLLALLELRPEESVQYQAESYPLIANSPGQVRSQLDHIFYMLATGNNWYALLLLERHLDSFYHPGMSELGRLHAATGFMRALSVLEYRGEGERLVQGSDSLQLQKLLNRDAPATSALTVRELKELFNSYALGLAKRFDERDQKSHHQDKVEQMLDPKTLRSKFIDLGGSEFPAD